VPRLSIACVALAGCLAAGVARAQSSQAVYADALVNGWQNWSWASVNPANGAPVQAGSRSIAVSAGPWQALYLHQSAFDSTIYNSLVFWINGGASGGQQLQVQATLNGNAQTVVTLAPLPANTWQQVTIPLAFLGVQSRANLDGFWIQDRSGTTQPQFYVDTISFTAAPAPSAVNLNVDAAQTVRTIDRRHFGVNAAVWDGLLDTATTKNLLTTMGNQALRFPGGSLSDDYHWATNTTGNNTWQWATSFTAFADVATTVGSQVFITVNYGSGTPQEAASWVSNSNVTSRYGFKYWEVGNEVYGSWETDNNTRPHDPYTYAQRFAQYYSQMKAADPAIKVGAVAVPGEDNYANYSDHPATNPVTGVTHNGWTPVMLATLKSLGVTPDFLIYHRYPQEPGGEYDQGLLLSSGTWASDAADLRMQLSDYLGSTIGSGVELACTENNSVSSAPGKQTTSLVNGLFMADSICAAMKTQFNAVIWWDLRNGQETGNNNSSTLYGWRQYGDYGLVDGANPPGPADGYPVYYVGKLLKYFARGGDQLIGASSDYPLLSICAARHADGSLALMAINKSATAMLNANISLSHATPASSGTQYSYGIPQDNAAQTGAGSADIASAAVSGIASSFSYHFPAYSVTVLTVANSAQPTPSPSPRPSASPTPTPVAVGKVQPASLSFGKQRRGTTSSAQTVTLSNTGNALLSVSSITISTGFTQTNNCTAPLAAGASCTLSVRFSPATRGSYAGSLKVNDNAANTPQTVSLSGSGT